VKRSIVCSVVKEVEARTCQEVGARYNDSSACRGKEIDLNVEKLLLTLMGAVRIGGELLHVVD
jgi:hypothetical protein